MSTTHHPTQIPANILEWPRTPTYAHSISTMLEGRGFPPKAQPTALDLSAARTIAHAPEFVEWARTTLQQLDKENQIQQIKERILRLIARRGSSDTAIGLAVETSQPTEPPQLHSIHFGLLPRSPNWEGVSSAWPLTHSNWTLIYQDPDDPRRVAAIASAPGSSLTEETKNLAQAPPPIPPGEPTTMADIANWHGSAQVLWIPTAPRPAT